VLVMEPAASWVDGIGLAVSVSQPLKSLATVGGGGNSVFRFLGISASEHIIAPRDATATPIWMVVKGADELGRMLNTASFGTNRKVVGSIGFEPSGLVQVSLRENPLFGGQADQ
jgi:hypothetical protein